MVDARLEDRVEKQLQHVKFERVTVSARGPRIHGQPYPTHPSEAEGGAVVLVLFKK